MNYFSVVIMNTSASLIRQNVRLHWCASAAHGTIGCANYMSWVRIKQLGCFSVYNSLRLKCHRIAGRRVPLSYNDEFCRLATSRDLFQVAKAFGRKECADILHLCVLISDATTVAIFFLMEVGYVDGRWIYNSEIPCSIPPSYHQMDLYWVAQKTTPPRLLI